MTTHFWAVPPIGTPAIQIDIDPEALGRNYPLLAGGQRRRQGDARAHARGGRPRRAPASARPGSRRRARSARNGATSTSRRSPPTPCRSGPSASAPSCPRHVPDDAIVVVDTGHAGMWMGGMYDLTQPDAELYAQRRPSRLGVSRPGSAPNARCPDRPVVTFTGDAGFWYHIGEIETAVRWKHQRRHRRQQQLRRQPVEARLRPRLWRHADRAGARAVDLQQDEFRPHRRGHGRGRHPGREARAISRRRSQQALEAEPAGRHRRRDRHRRAGADRGDVTCVTSGQGVHPCGVAGGTRAQNHASRSGWQTSPACGDTLEICRPRFVTEP